MLTNHIRNLQQKKHTQWPQTCTPITPPATELNLRQKSSTLQKLKLEAAPSAAFKGAA